MKKNTFRNLIKLMSLLAAVMIFVSLAVSCEKQGDVEITTAEATSGIPDETQEQIKIPDGLVLIAAKATAYRLIRPADLSSNDVAGAITAFEDAVNRYMLLGSGKYMLAERDTTDPSNCEILVGATSRPESADAIEGLAEGDYTVRLAGYKLVIAGKGDEATAEALRWFTDCYIEFCEGLALPLDFNYVRSAAPTITGMSQEDFYWDLSTDSPEILIDVSCPGGEPELIRFTVDGRDITNSVSFDGKTIRMAGVSFENGMHKAKIVLRAPGGQEGCEVFSFGTGECDTMNLYKGEVHAHTSDSDGIGTPAEAYEYARDVAKLDFFAVTDHSNSYPEADYKNVHVPLADSFNEPGKFAAICGYEETYNNSTGYYGHLNTINTPVYALRSENLAAYYKKMTKAEGAVVQFNHPGYSWGNFLEYGLYSEKSDSVVNLFEFKGSSYDNEWALCLAKGWHVSPMHNEDNHAGQWGTVNEAVGYVLAPSLTRQNIIEAMTMNRTYTTTDQSLQIYFSINDTWMGGRLDNPDELNVTVKLKTHKTLGTVQIIAEDNIVVASSNQGGRRELEWNLTLKPEFDYYYVKVNGSGFAVTAPVWIENRDAINIEGLTRELVAYNNGTDKDHKVTASFKAEKAMTDVTVKFYVSALSGFDITTAKCVGEEKIGAMPAGQTRTSSVTVAYSQSTPRVTAVVTGTADGGTYSDTRYLQLTPLLFSEITGSANGWSYVEIYNATADTIDLSGYSIRIWPKAGAKSDALAEKTLSLSGKLAGHTAVVVWLNTETGRTVADFNAKFGSSLVEGQGIINLTSTWGAPLTRGVQIDILNGTKVISRAQYNFGTDSADVAECRSVVFTYRSEYTLTAEKKKVQQTPTPGSIDETLMPALILKAS